MVVVAVVPGKKGEEGDGSASRKATRNNGATNVGSEAWKSSNRKSRHVQIQY